MTGHVSCVGDTMARTALYEAANAILSRVTRFSALKRWGMDVAKRRGMKRAKVALARKLGVILHRMWIEGTIFRWTEEASQGRKSRAPDRTKKDFKAVLTRAASSEVPSPGRWKGEAAGWAVAVIQRTTRN